MFAMFSYVSSKTRSGINYKITYRKLFGVDYIEVICFNKKKIRAIEKKIYKKAEKAIVSKNLKDINFRKLCVYSINNYKSQLTNDVFNEIMSFYTVERILVVDANLNNIDLIKRIVVKCKMLYIKCDDRDEFLNFCENIYFEFGVLPILYNESFAFDIGIDFDENLIMFKKEERAFKTVKGSASFNEVLNNCLPIGIDLVEVFCFLKEYKIFEKQHIRKYCLSRSNQYIEINKENVKNLLDN